MEGGRYPFQSDFCCEGFFSPLPVSMSDKENRRAVDIKSARGGTAMAPRHRGGGHFAVGRLPFSFSKKALVAND